MTESEHQQDTSLAWIKFFFICFFLVVFGIGIYAAFNYRVNAPTATQASGH